MNIEKNKNTESKIGGNSNFVEWKKNIPLSLSEDKNTQAEIKTTLDTIVASHEFTEQEIQIYFSEAVKSIEDLSLLMIPWIIKEKIHFLIEKNPRKNKKEYSDVIQDFNSLQQSYPQHKITEQYKQANSHIFEGTQFQSPEEQKTILSYKYILEQIIQERQQNSTPLTTYEHTLVQNFNTFCFDTGIKAQIELPKTENLSSARDLITHDNLGQHLYQNNDTIKQFIDQKQTTPIQFTDTTFIQHITKLYPEEILKDITNTLQNKQLNPKNSIDIKQLITNNSLNTQYIEELWIKDTISDIQIIINKYIQQAQEHIQSTTTKIINQHTLGVCLQTVASYFDTITINQDDFAGDMKLDASTININHKTNIVTIRWTINGKELTIFYNLQDGTIHTQDFIFANSGAVFVGNNIWQKEQLNFRWPRYDDIQKKWSNHMQKNIENYVNKGSLNSVEKNMRQWLRRKVSVDLDEVLGHDIMEHTIEKNLATKQIQQLLSIWVPNAWVWSKNIHPEIWQLYNIFDKSMDFYTPTELRKLRWLIVLLTNIIHPIAQKNTEAQQDSTKDPLWVKSFNQEKMNNDRQNKTKDSNSFYKFFKTLTNNTHNEYMKDVINLETLTRRIMSYLTEGISNKKAQTEELKEWSENSTESQDLKELEKQLG